MVFYLKNLKDYYFSQMITSLVLSHCSVFCLHLFCGMSPHPKLYIPLSSLARGSKYAFLFLTLMSSLDRKPDLCRQDCKISKLQLQSGSTVKYKRNSSTFKLGKKNPIQKFSILSIMLVQPLFGFAIILKKSWHFAWVKSLLKVRKGIPVAFSQVGGNLLHPLK